MHSIPLNAATISIILTVLGTGSVCLWQGAEKASQIQSSIEVFKSTIADHETRLRDVEYDRYRRTKMASGDIKE